MARKFDKCTSCGGTRDNSNSKLCSKCREKHRQSALKKTKQAALPPTTYAEDLDNRRGDGDDQWSAGEDVEEWT